MVSQRLEGLPGDEAHAVVVEHRRAPGDDFGCRQVARLLVGYTGKTSNPNELEDLADGLSALVERLGPGEASGQAANSFDELRLSKDLRQLACLQPHELLSAEEFGRFSSETRGAVPILLGV
jgi:hypothetical protein